MRISIYIDSFFVDFKKRFLSFQCVFFWLKTGFCLKINQKTKQTTPSYPTESKGLEKPSFPSFMAQMKIGSKVVELNMLKIRAITNDFALWFDFQVRFSSFIKQYPFSVSCHHIPKNMIIQLIFLPMTEYPFPWCPVKNWWHSVIDSTSKFLNDDIL